MSILQIRLKSCLQTILDLEPELQENGGCFDREFSSLRSFLNRIDQMNLDEEDVEKLEDTTVKVLEEFARCGINDVYPARLLH